MGCATFGLTSPATVTTDGNGVATAVSFSLTQQTATVPGGRDDKGSGRQGGYNRRVPHGRLGHRENGAGM